MSGPFLSDVAAPLLPYLPKAGAWLGIRARRKGSRVVFAGRVRRDGRVISLGDTSCPEVAALVMDVARLLLGRETRNFTLQELADFPAAELEALGGYVKGKLSLA